jgi:hypothetical protein
VAELILQLELGLNKAQARFTEAARKRSEEFSMESLEFEKDNNQNSRSAPMDRDKPNRATH